MKFKIFYDMTRTTIPGAAKEGSQGGSASGFRGGVVTAGSGGGRDLANVGKLNAKTLVAELGAGEMAPS